MRPLTGGSAPRFACTSLPSLPACGRPAEVRDLILTEPSKNEPWLPGPMVFAADLSSWLGFDLDLDKIKTEVKWKDFGNGSRMGKIHRDGDAGAVLYHVAADADPECFQPHTHTGGEMYLVLEGEVYDENGTFPKGSLVWMDAGSRHTPKCRGETYILTLWPGGVTG